jgi:CTP synthase
MDAESIYDVPLLMQSEKLDQVSLRKLGLKDETTVTLNEWNSFLRKLKNPKATVNIAVVGKYVELQDAYKSIAESFIHSGAANECKVKVNWIHSEEINADNVSEKLQTYHGLLVAPGFGNRGIEGKIESVKYARENNVPFLGICLGMQCAVIEYARNVLKLKDAHTTEINPDTTHPVIDIMEHQKEILKKGGTMRLGSYACNLEDKSKAFDCYKNSEIQERHRHRYEFNNDYKAQLEENGMRTTGVNPESSLVEIVEIDQHPWFVGVQSHPEYKSTVAKPQPLFVGFVNAALTYSKQH